jgi:hypothetical protein
VAERGGATRIQKLAGVDVYSYRERTEEGEVVWEVAGDGVSSMECSEGVFIGQEGAGARVSSGGLAGNFPGRGGSGGDVGRVGRSGGVLRLLRTRYGMLVTSATVSSRAYWSGDREATVDTFPPSTGRGPA